MKRCLNNITLGSEVPFTESVMAASKAGFEGLEIFSLEKARKYAESASVDELNSMFDSLSIEPIGFVLGGFVYKNDPEFAESLPGLTEMMSLAGEIGARNALVFVPSKGELDEGEATERAIQRIGEACDMAAQHGLIIGLEPIGKADFLNHPLQMLPLMSEVDASNLALTIDIFHFFTGGGTIQDLSHLVGKRINLIHVDDAPVRPDVELDDSKRVLPGSGGMEVVGFLRELRKIGFDGPLSVELFNRELWDMDPEAVAAMSKQALDAVMAQAGVE